MVLPMPRVNVALNPTVATEPPPCSPCTGACGDVAGMNPGATAHATVCGGDGSGKPSSNDRATPSACPPCADACGDDAGEDAGPAARATVTGGNSSGETLSSDIVTLPMRRCLR